MKIVERRQGGFACFQKSVSFRISFFQAVTLMKKREGCEQGINQ